MKKLPLTVAMFMGAFLVPTMAFAVSGPQEGLGIFGQIVSVLISFINNFLVPFIFALGFVVFIWGMFQYFIYGGANEESRDKGRQLIIYSVIAFVLMLSLWGLVNVIASGLGFTGDSAPILPRVPIPGGNNGAVDTGTWH